ncbi:MAG: PH domain-containing protein [Muribaculaceae bacterium]|nr:PH domain-containing protein [Muribaculaceae bacterium]
MLYKSRWDSGTWLMLGLMTAFCIAPIFFDDDGWMPLVVGGVMFVVVIIMLLSVYYKIEGDKLKVYTFFIPSSYPIDKISMIEPTKSILSAPAAALTHRMAIHFSDRRILKSMMPLVISPANQQEFIGKLLEINPNIDVKPGVTDE